MDLFVYDEQDRRYLPARVAALLAVAAAVLVAAVVLLITSRSGPAAAGPAAAVATAVPAGDAPSEECRAALEQAEEVLASAQRVREALADQTEIMNELLAERVEPRAAVRQALPSLTSGARDSVQFDVGRQGYDEAARQCRAGG